MKKIFYQIPFVVLMVMLLSACDMDLQTDYNYKSSVDDPHINMTAWEYITSHSAEFSQLKDAIEYAEVQEYYQQTSHKYTFLLLNNTAMKTYMENVFPGETLISNCDKETVKNMLLYHIVDGEYSSYGQLDVEPRYVLTLLKGESGLMMMNVWKNPWQAAVGKIIVNQSGSNSKSPQRAAITSNIMPTNGVIHIFDNYCYYRK